ncbi:KRFB protein, partial [Turnix velox]|nr:KRFB protein [Turnix velox]
MSGYNLRSYCSQPLADNEAEPCVRQCPDSEIVIQPSPIFLFLPGPIMRTTPLNPVVSFSGPPFSGGSGGSLGSGGYNSLGNGGLGGCNRGYGGWGGSRGLYGYGGGSSLGYRGLYGYGRSYGSGCCSPYSYRYNRYLYGSCG